MLNSVDFNQKHIFFEPIEQTQSRKSQANPFPGSKESPCANLHAQVKCVANGERSLGPI